MTENEEKLLEIAKEFIELNQKGFLDLRLTGSLMLAHRGIKKPREAHDIDFLVCEEIIAYERDGGSDFSVMYPKGYVLSYDGYRSQPDSVQLTHIETGLKIDFMISGEAAEMVEGVPCGSVECLIEAKYGYALNDKDPISRKKHSDDIVFLELNNPKELLR